MQTFTKRQLFGVIVTTMIGASLASCATTTAGSTTVKTINVGRINAYIDAGMNATSTILGIVQQFPAFVGYVEPIQKITTVLQDTSHQFTDATKGQLTVSYDNTDVRTIIDSVFVIFQQLASLIKVIIANMVTANLTVPHTTVSRVELIYTSLATLISILKAMLYPTYVQTDIPEAEVHALKTLSA